MPKISALIVVDVQNDFCEGGTLAVRDGDAVVAPLNRLIEVFTKKRLPVIFTRDWHPKDHRSFKGHGGRWPPHCVQGTRGAAFHPDLIVPKDGIVVSKGDSDADAYSGFEGTALEAILRMAHVTAVWVGGLATDYCVKNTTIDAAKKGFRTSVIADCVRGVNLSRTDSASAFRKMVSSGVLKTTSASAVRAVGRRVAILSSS